MQFQCYGPFRYELQSNAETTRLFVQTEAARTGLEHAMGLYLFAAENASGDLLPWYVGKAIKHDIGGRLFGHLNKDKFARFAHGGSGLSIFLLAAVTVEGQFLAKEDLTGSHVEAIGKLEFALIGSAVEVNHGLLNKHGRRSAKYVPDTELILLDSADCLSTLSNLLGFESGGR